MKSFRLVLLFVALFSLTLQADEASLKASLTAADDARVSAMKAPDKEKLEAVFSKDLYYAHSSGVVDTRDSFVENLVSGKTKYERLDYDQREFSFPAPGIALMTGKLELKVMNAKGGVETPMGFLAVWRLEDGVWRFLAWQSNKLPKP